MLFSALRNVGINASSSIKATLSPSSMMRRGMSTINNQTSNTLDSNTSSYVQKLRDQLRFYAVIVNRLNDVKVGDVLQLDRVRELGSKDYSLMGQPYVQDSIYDIQATVIEHTKSKLIQIVKKKRRKNYKRTIEHKQTHTVLRISKVDVVKQ
ncbi:unnamed protein product [Absidia cylindrospora]